VSTPRRLDVHESVRRHDVETDRGRFAVWACQPHGSALPRGHVVLVPGFTGSKEDFGPLLPELAAAGWSAITYDQRGQFETPAAPGDDLTLDGWAVDLLALTSHLVPEQESAHLVGHSFGGLVSRQAVLTAPQRWASLTLLCSGPGAFGEPQRRELLDAANSVLRDGLEATYLAKRDRDRRRGLPEPPPEIEQFLHKRFLANSPESLSAMSRTLADTADRTDELAGLGLPVAVVRGEEDDAWPHHVQQDMAERLDTSVVVIPDAAVFVFEPCQGQMMVTKHHLHLALRASYNILKGK
jgi:pimeloyl-ACP methyl ester carboxylesterase